MPRKRKNFREPTALKSAEAHRLLNEVGLDAERIGRLMECTRNHVTGNLLGNPEHAEQLFFLLKHGREVFTENFRALSKEGATIEDLGLSRIPDLGAYPQDLITLNSPKPDDEVKTKSQFPEYSFLNGWQAEAWFRALESGVEQWVACDSAGLDRDSPHEWVRAAKTGSEEHVRWLDDCKRISSRAYIRLREKLAQAPKTWKGIDAAIKTFVVFDGVDVGKTSAEEMKEILLQLVPQIEEGA